MEGDGTESGGADTAWGGRVVTVEFRDFFRSVADLVRIFPGIAFCSVAFPLD